VRRPFVPASPEEAEAHAEDLAYGAGARPWTMDPDRHECSCWFGGEPVDTGVNGKFRFKWRCIGCNRVIEAPSDESIRRKALDHEEGRP
jgi:hypothetical protein